MVLTPSQLRRLRALPLSPAGNRISAAVALVPKLTQVALAQALGMSQQYVSDVARGRYDTITVENAHRFAEFFGCAIEDLFPAREAVAS